MLQLLHERRHPSLRKTGALEALRDLRDIDIVPDEDYLLLSEEYRFLRRLDHRLRLEQDQSLDILERESTKLQGIAHAMGYKGDD
jgi:glutamate-ammonia-ligase adenylyltransferase